MFCKVFCKLNFEKVKTYYTYGKLTTYEHRWGSAKIQNTMDPDWLQQDHYQPTVFFHHVSSHYTFIPTTKNPACISKMLSLSLSLSPSLSFFLLKLCESEISYVHKSLELVTNYQPTPHTTPEEEKPQLHNHRSLKSLNFKPYL